MRTNTLKKSTKELLAALDYTQQYPYGEHWKADVIDYDAWYFNTKLRHIRNKDIEKIKALMQSLGVGVTSVFMRDGEIYVQDQDDQCFDLAGNMNLFVEPPATLLWLRVDKIKERSARIRKRRWGNTDKESFEHFLDCRKSQLARIRKTRVI